MHGRFSVGISSLLEDGVHEGSMVIDSVPKIEAEEKPKMKSRKGTPQRQTAR